MLHSLIIQVKVSSVNKAEIRKYLIQKFQIMLNQNLKKLQMN